MHFEHASLEAAVRQRFLRREADRVRWHRQLAAFFQSDNVDELRRCDELGWHLAQCGDMQGLRQFLAGVRHFDLLTSSTYNSLDFASLWREAGVSRAGPMFVLSGCCTNVPPCG